MFLIIGWKNNFELVFVKEPIYNNFMVPLKKHLMPKLIDEIPLLTFKINIESSIPLYKQLYELLRNSILDGKIQPGKRLPGTRSLAAELNISRNTVAIAFDQLRIEGYITGKTGSGYFVSEIPDKKPLPVGISNEKLHPAKEFVKLKKYSSGRLRENYRSDEIIPFQNGIPALNYFPIRTWLKIINQTASYISDSLLGYSDAAGFRPLREAIASYLKTYRAVNCTAEQVLIVNGSQQGLDLIGRILLKKGSKVWLEDPGYLGIRDSMISAGASIHPCPLDDEGIDINFSWKHNPKPDLIYTTPSHQFPIGITMSVARRMQLLNFAIKNKCWIIEDDYDSEFRYVGNPLPSLQGMDQSKSVLYLGTFSKVLVPGLRLGYLVLPDSRMLNTFASMKYIMDRQSPILEQIVLAKYIEDGHFTKHIRKMRMLYKSRQEYLISEINKNMDGLISVNSSPSGMHIIAWLPQKLSDKKVFEAARKLNLILNPLSGYTLKYFKAPGSIIGYTGFNEVEIKEGLNKFKRILSDFLK